MKQKTSLKTKSIIKLFENKGIEQTIKFVFPVIFISAHVPKIVRSKSWVSIFLGTFFLLSKFLFMKREILPTPNYYDVLFYVPNIKYKKYLEALTSNTSFSYLIISEDLKGENIISVNKFNVTNPRIYSSYLFKVLLYIFILSIKTNQFSDFKKYYWNILSFVRRHIIVDYLVENIQFKKYFSFHPVEGFHQIIQKFFKTKFKDTYAIRPTTTSMAKEHQFISTDNLFYKTEDELSIYQRSNLKGVKLIKGGLIAENKLFEKDTARNAILFLDTCTNVSPDSITIRRKAVTQFLHFVSKLNSKVYYKFHPALIDSELKRTKEKINSLAKPNIKILDSDIPWEKIGLAIGFDTTVFYECFLNKIPVLSFREKYYMFPNPINEFTISPVMAIKNESDFEIISKLLNDKVIRNNKKSEQYQWFSEKYNYPAGMNTIKQILAE